MSGTDRWWQLEPLVSSPRLELSFGDYDAERHRYPLAIRPVGLESCRELLESYQPGWPPEKLRQVLERLNYRAEEDTDRETVHRWGQELGADIGLRDGGALLGALRAAGFPPLVIRSLGRRSDTVQSIPWELMIFRDDGDIPIRLSRGDAVLRCLGNVRPLPPPPGDGGLILFAWSSAGGPVGAAEHRSALKDALRAAGCAPDEALVELPHATLSAISRRVRRLREGGRIVRIIHLLAHGGAVGQSSYGLLLGEDPQRPQRVNPEELKVELRQLHRLSLLSIHACQEARAIPGAFGALLVEAARTGIGPVVGSQFPITRASAAAVARSFFRELLAPAGGRRDIARALQAATRSIYHAPPEARVRGEPRHDWAALVLLSTDERAPPPRPEAWNRLSPEVLLGDERWVDALQLGGKLLGFCAHHRGWLAAHLQDTARLRALSALRARARDFIEALDDEVFERSDLKSLLALGEPGDHPAFTARGLALALDDALGGPTNGARLWELHTQRGSRQLGEGDPVAIRRDAALMLLGKEHLSSPRERRGTPLTETAHLRLVPPLGARRLQLTAHRRDFLAPLLRGLTVAFLMPSARLDELVLDRSHRDEQPRAAEARPADPALHEQRLLELVTWAHEAGAILAILPELSVTPELLQQLREHPERPRTLLAGSLHRRLGEGEAPPGAPRWRNTAVLLHPGGELQHHKLRPSRYGPYEEDILCAPATLTVHATPSWSLSILIGDDLLASPPSIPELLGQLGVGLTLIPARANQTGAFEAGAALLADRARGLVAMVNTADPGLDPAPASALLGLPAGGAPPWKRSREELSLPAGVLVRIAPGRPPEVIDWHPIQS